MGGCAIDETGQPLPDETLAACQAADAVLLGAVGGPKWDIPAPKSGPNRACWPCAKSWDSTPTCARSRFSRNCATPPA